MINCFWINQVHTHPSAKKLGLPTATNKCLVLQVVGSCTQTKLYGGLQRLHSADDVADYTPAFYHILWYSVRFVSKTTHTFGQQFAELLCSIQLHVNVVTV